LRLQGSIRVTAPEGVSISLLGPHLARFCQTHTDIHIDLAVTGSALQLSRREADVAVRVTSKPPDTSIGRQVCRFRFGMYASLDYLNRHSHDDLKDCNWVMTDDSRDWFPASTWKRIGQSGAKISLSSNSTMAVVQAAKLGLGIAPLPCFLGDSEPSLVRVIEPPEDMQLELWILTHPDLRHTARVKALMQFLFESLGEQKDLIEGNLALRKQ